MHSLLSKIKNKKKGGDMYLFMLNGKSGFLLESHIFDLYTSEVTMFDIYYLYNIDKVC